MKKIPTLFVREFENGRIKRVTESVTPGMEWVLRGEGEATVEIDGSCCAIIGGELYKRYDAKKGKKPPEGAIPCGEPDPITGHWPHWVKCERANPADKWFFAAMDYNIGNEEFTGKLCDGTYEAVGVHFQNNPYGFGIDKLIRHGATVVPVERSYEGIRSWLENSNAEGLVFWLNGEPMCKIKRTDFGFPWPIR